MVDMMVWISEDRNRDGSFYGQISTVQEAFGSLGGLFIDGP